MELDGKVAVVYGAGGSMGGAIARAFGTAGATVMLAGRTGSRVGPRTGSSAITGTASRKTEPHQKSSSIAPPISGPIAPPAE